MGRGGAPGADVAAPGGIVARERVAPAPLPPGPRLAYRYRPLIPPQLSSDTGTGVHAWLATAIEKKADAIIAEMIRRLEFIISPSHKP